MRAPRNSFTVTVQRARRGGLLVPILAAFALAVSTPVVAPSRVAAAGCSNRLFTSGFHEKIGDAPIVPLSGLPADGVSVPTWNGSFTTDGQTYPHTMVGTDPAAGSATTTVPVVIVPLRLDFASTHCTQWDPTMTTHVLASPLFHDTPTIAGTTQYVDALQRGNFWASVSTTSPDWHLLLGAPKVLPVQNMSVPAAQGLTAFDSAANRPVGIAGGKWLFTAIHGMVGSLHLDPRALVIFLAYNTFATDDNPAACLTTFCSLYSGLHNAFVGPHLINTYAFAAVRDFGDQVPAGLDVSTVVLSHEVEEWANDPFVHGTRVKGQGQVQLNTAPSWSSPYYSFGCSNALEVADPLEDSYWVAAASDASPDTYLLANMAFQSWFARESPSTAILGRYDALGVFDGPSTPC